jgi:NADH:ubiquinone oxidoreductase subunit K
MPKYWAERTYLLRQEGYLYISMSVRQSGQDYFHNYIFAIFVIALAAAEAAIGLSILSSIHHNRKSTRINQSNFLNN